MESGQKSLDELRSSLMASDGQVFVRLVADAGLRTVWSVVAGAPAEVPGWQSQIWRYLSASFIATPVPSATLATALDSTSGGILALRGHELLSCLSGASPNDPQQPLPFVVIDLADLHPLGHARQSDAVTPAAHRFSPARRRLQGKRWRMQH